ncbi:MAG: hypothetical protein CMI53_01110 [Parcubacteria group bacterium]|nr:hypothetical protein [Parcubacteria group bacterium]|tara:strand:- start:11772 stop:13589 length:1818 start_codon:yes stop_codon:yes gene_type:complete
MNLKKFNINFLLSSIIFLISGVVYLFTLAPSITMEDSGELVAAAYTLGIPHPPGFPLYVILGKLFTFIPLGSIAWRVNLMSAFFGALTIALLYLIIHKTTRNKIIAFSFSLMFAFSPVFWSQSLIAEVYTLNTFFVALLILILLIWQENKKNKYLLWFAFLFGLSLTNHTMSVLLAPAFGLYILLSDKSFNTNWKLIFKMFFLFLLGLTVYLYLPLRASQSPVFNWGPITAWPDVWNHISRAQYDDFSPLVNTYSKTGVVITFFFEIYQQFFLPTLLLAFGGAVYLLKKSRALAVLTIGIFLLNGVAIIYLRKFGWTIGIEYTYRVYYLPVFMIIIFWFAHTAEYLYTFFVKALKKSSVLSFKFFQIVFFIVLFSLPISFLIMNYKRSDLSNYWLAYDYGKNLLNSMEPDSLYYFAYDETLQGDSEIFSIIYFKMVENLRSDIDIISEHNFFYKDVAMRVPKDHYALTFDEKRNEIIGLLQEVEDRPIYTNFSVTNDDFALDIFSRSNGYVHKIYSNFAEAKKGDLDGYNVTLRNIDEIDEFSSYPDTGLASHYYYNLATFYLNDGQIEKSQEFLVKAIAFDPLPFNHEYRRYIDYRGDWLEDSE